MDHVKGMAERHGAEIRLGTKVDRILLEGDRVSGDCRLTDGEVIGAPVVVSNLDPTSTFTRLIDPESMPDWLVRRVTAVDHRAAYLQVHFALHGLPEFAGPYEFMNEGSLRPSMGLFGSPRGHAAPVRGLPAGHPPR